jgi:hypothetical protein
VYGSSGHVRSLAEILKILDYEILGFIDSYLPKHHKVLNYRIIGSEDVLFESEKTLGTNKVFIGFGDIKGRKKAVEKLEK